MKASRQTLDDIGFFIVTKVQEKIRLDKLLPTLYPQYSRSYFQYLIENGSVLVNGEQLKKRESLHEGDEVEIAFLFTPESDLKPESIPLEVLFEDEHILAINKPPGMVVHPAPGHPSGTFVNALLHHCQAMSISPGDVRPGIVHRLDKDTSGVLLAAKTVEAHRALITLFTTRQIDKTYVAICIGKPPEGLFSAPIGRHPKRRQEMAIIESGKEAITHFRIFKEQNGLSVVEAKPVTGRTHQIRVHLRALKAPIIGDLLYGLPAINKKSNTQRQLLHAHSIAFRHPITHALLNIVAPFPDDMNHYISNVSANLDFRPSESPGVG